MNSNDSSKQSNEPTLRGHVYDGIQEYDQKLPNWWLFTWYITMVWFVVAWLAYYQLGYGRTDAERIGEQLAKVEAVRAKELEAIDDKKLWEMSRTPEVVEAGKATFMATCVACHAADLSAHLAGVKLPGLPLNDTEWKHGGNPIQLMTIVRKGAPDITKGMASWESLGVKKITEVVAFIMSHHKEGEPITLAADSPLKEGAVTTPTAGAAPKS
jgi:cytochrome c oxidase cbb3-type subunit III